MRVLIAEDERITRASLTRQIDRWGHEVVSADNGLQAWERFQSEPFDIVVTDWEMPEISGVELIRRIRAAESADYVYIILLTSRSDKSDIVSGIEAGADDYVSKPFDRDELRVRLLAGQRVVGLERALKQQNAELREAGERMRRDLLAAARVQRAMLPKSGLSEGRVHTCFQYVPTDELAGDGLGFHLISDRFLLAYVVDVTGHGVPAALLAVTAMHALSPAANDDQDAPAADETGELAVPRPGQLMTALNRRFCAGDNDGRFLTMILCVLDTATGVLRFARAGHPLPILLRNGGMVPVDTEGGFPLGIVDGFEYEEIEVRLEPGDRVFLYSDGVTEQCEAAGREEFGEHRINSELLKVHESSGQAMIGHLIEALTTWAGTASFKDDVSLLVFDWMGS